MARERVDKSKVIREVEQYVSRAEIVFKESAREANQLIKKAKSLAMRYRLKLPSHIKRRMCKHCDAFLVLGINCRVRNKTGKIIYACFSCKKYSRIGYSKNNKTCKIT